LIIRKSAAEIEKMTRAGRVVHGCLQMLAAAVRPGVSTAELDRMAEDYIRSHGAVPTFKGYRGFPSSICASPNDMIVHGIPGETVLDEGDILSIDVGVTLEDYVGDSAITVPVGEVSEEAFALMAATRESLGRAIEQCREGNRVGDISHAVQAYVEERGYSVVRSLVGHGIGRDMHEDPQVPNFGAPGKGPRLVAGMVLAIEPMVNAGRYEVEMGDDGWAVYTRDGTLSAHFEHTVAVTSNGPRVLTEA